MKLRFEQKLAIANTIAEQIFREQSLTANRMNWNLTFQGFMIAAFALVAAAELTQPARIWLEVAICVAGSVVAGVTIVGIRAAQTQSSYLKNEFRRQFMLNEFVKPDFPYPRPFSADRNSKNARFVSISILGVLILMWVSLLSVVVYEHSTSPRPVSNAISIKTTELQTHIEIQKTK
ncbi:hypothetical protein MMA231_01346 [Asticcacaulis sp. MM231]